MCICLFVLRLHKKNMYIYILCITCWRSCAWMRNEPYWCMKQNLKHLWTNMNVYEEFPWRIQLLLRQRWSDCTELLPFSCCHTSRIHTTTLTQKHTQRERHFSVSSFRPSRRLNSKPHKAQSMSVGCILAPFLLYLSFCYCWCTCRPVFT